jgi:hypothetical protein
VSEEQILLISYEKKTNEKNHLRSIKNNNIRWSIHLVCTEMWKRIHWDMKKRAFSLAPMEPERSGKEGCP